MGQPHRLPMGATARRRSGEDGTTLASRGWRARVALASLLRELRQVGERGFAASGSIGGGGWLGRIRLFVRQLGLTMPGRWAGVRSRGMTRATAEWRGVPDGTASATLPRLRLNGDHPVRYAEQVARRAEVELGDVDALLARLGDIDAEELETALRVVRRVRVLAGAA